VNLKVVEVLTWF